MLTEPDPKRPADCMTELALDEWLAGEASVEASERWQAHVAGCASCQARREERIAFNRRYLESVGGAEAAVARLAARASARRRAHRWLYASGAVAAAASLLLLLRPSLELGPEGTRSKGAGRLGFYVQSRGTVREGFPGEQVHPGDALRFVVARGEPRHVAVLGFDSRGVASLYYPSGPEPARVPAAAAQELGSGTPLDRSVVLDDAPGVERLYGVFCEAAVPPSTLRQELATSGRLAARPGCEIVETSIRKVVP